MAAEWLAVRQFVRHECDEPLADFVLRTGRLPLTAWQASTHYGLPLVLVLLPAVILAIAVFTDGFSRATFAAFPWKWCAALPLALAVITARRQYRKLPLHAGPHTAEGRGFRPPAGGAVPASGTRSITARIVSSDARTPDSRSLRGANGSTSSSAKGRCRSTASAIRTSARRSPPSAATAATSA